MFIEGVHPHGIINETEVELLAIRAESLSERIPRIGAMIEVEGEEVLVNYAQEELGLIVPIIKLRPKLHTYAPVLHALTTRFPTIESRSLIFPSLVDPQRGGVMRGIIAASDISERLLKDGGNSETVVPILQAMHDLPEKLGALHKAQPRLFATRGMQ